MLSQEADVNNTNNKNQSPPPQNSSDASSAPVISQYPVQNTMRNFDVQNISRERTRPLILTQSTLSSIEINNPLLNGVSVVKNEPRVGVIENAMEPMRIASSKMNVCEKHGNSFGNNEDSILGLPSDVSVTSYSNHCEILPKSRRSQLCSRDLLTSFVTKLDHMNTTLFFPSVDHTVSAAETQNLFIHSELFIKTEPSAEDKLLLPEGDNLRTNFGECSETTLRDTGVPSVSVEMLAKQKDQCGTQSPFIHSEIIVKTEQSSEDEIYLPEDDYLGTKNGEHSGSTLQCTSVPSVSEAEMAEQNEECGSDYSASRCVEEEPVPSQQQLPAESLEMAERETSKSAVRVLPGLLSRSEKPHVPPSATRLSHRTVCESDFSGPFRCDSQVRSSLLEKQYRCQYCSCTFALKSHLKRHEQTTHIRLKSSKCTECNYASANRSVLKNHKRTHTAKKQYKCKECDFTTAYSSCLKTHQRTHSGIKPYKCTECDYTTSNRYNLTTHQRTHSGIKPYKCAECNYTTAHSSDLNTHLRSHSGIKPFKCTDCDYTTAQSSNLKRHQRTHSGVKPFKCMDCDFTTANSSHLKRHKRIHSDF